MRHFDYDGGGVLRAEACDLRDIAQAVGTPTFVYVRATIERHFQVFDDAFAGHPHVVCYSVKANSNAGVLNLLARMGSGADIVSGGELARATAAGIPADRIVFSGVGKTKPEMAAALDAKILSFNVESEPELDALAEVAKDKLVVAPVSLRVNPDVDPQTHPYIATGLAESKFGIPLASARGLAERIRGTDSLDLVGIDCHIGSQLTNLDPLMEALDALIELVDELKTAGHAIKLIDIGGGLGIPYGDEPERAPPHPTELGAAVKARMKGRQETIVLEPGRVIVGNAGLLLTRVLYVKQTPTKTFAVVDGGMNDLLRPSLYKAHHDILPVVRRDGAQQIEQDVVGPICESTDFFAKKRSMQLPMQGDLLAVMSAGAYSFSMASTYNSRPTAAEVLVGGDRWFVVRERQTLEALTNGEHIPAWDRPSSADGAKEEGEGS